MCCPDVFVRCKGIVFQHHYTDRKNKAAIEFMIDHVDRFKSLPSIEQLYAVSGLQIEKTEFNQPQIDWFFDTYEHFSRQKEIISVILKSTDLIENNELGKLETEVKRAVSMGLFKDMGVNYYANPKERIENMLKNNHKLSTGFQEIDRLLYGGVDRGTLDIFAGQPGAGKSTLLQNVALNSSQLGYHVIYFTLELSISLTAHRLDAMVSGMSTRETTQKIDEVDLIIRNNAKATSGSLQIVKMPIGTTANDIRSFIAEYKVMTGMPVDVIALDYMDLCSPYTVKVNSSDIFTKDKYVSEEMRDLAAELDVALYTASQLNRSSYDEDADINPSKISGGISKINTADLVFAIKATHEMKEQGVYELTALKTRTSNGVGKTISLGYDPKSMKLFDSPNTSSPSTAVVKLANNILDTIKNSKGVKNNQQQDISSIITNDAAGFRSMFADDSSNS